MTLQEKIKKITIARNGSLIAALQQMDREGFKSLLIVEDGRLISLISIGDIQRAIIRNVPLESAVIDSARREITISHTYESLEDIRKKMIRFRTELMPVQDEKGLLHDVLFWKDIFPQEETTISRFETKVPVVIMAGGFGTRLKPLTNVIPKPLVPIGDQTILEVIIRRFHDLGVSDFYLTVNYKSEMIRFYFDQLQDKSYELHYMLEEKPLGTAGSLHLLKGKIDTTFFVTNCDIIVEDDYTKILEYHKAHENDITLVAALKHFRIPYGTVESGEKGELLMLKEKPEMVFMINTGMYILEPKVLEQIPDNSFIHITEVIEQIKEKGGRVGVFPISEKSWYDIGEWPEYQKIIDKYK